MIENKRLLYWTPRLLCVLFAAFLAIFAADVIETPAGLGETMLALAMHLIPSVIVLAALIVVWRHEWVGAIVFPLLALLHLMLAWGRLHWSGYVAIEAPLLLMGLLFGLSWRYRVVSHG